MKSLCRSRSTCAGTGTCMTIFYVDVLQDRPTCILWYHVDLPVGASYQETSFVQYLLTGAFVAASSSTCLVFINQAMRRA